MVEAQVIIYLMGAFLFSMNLFIGSYLLIRIRRTGLSNIYWLSFYFFFTVIESSLKKRLIKLEIKETDLIIEILFDKLKKFQSLISMSNI